MKPRKLICLITDRRRLSPRSQHSDSLDRLVEFVDAAAHAGVDLIQLRERDLPAGELVTLAERCVAAAGNRTAVLVNDRFDVAWAAGAQGVHLRSDSVDAVTVRHVAPPGFLIGRSVHGEAEAAEVASSGAVDYLIFGTVFSSESKPADHPIAGPEALARVCKAVTVPVLAIGGVTLHRVEAVARTGAGVAAIGLFIPPGDKTVEDHVRATVVTLRAEFDRCGTGP